MLPSVVKSHIWSSAGLCPSGAGATNGPAPALSLLGEVHPGLRSSISSFAVYSKGQSREQKAPMALEVSARIAEQPGVWGTRVACAKAALSLGRQGRVRTVGFVHRSTQGLTQLKLKPDRPQMDGKRKRKHVVTT